MVHIKWLIALVLTAALSAYVSNYFTEKYAIEMSVAVESGSALNRTGYYTGLVKAIDEGKYDEVRNKLEKMWKLEVDLIGDYKKILESGYFKNLNAAEIERINRYLAPAGKEAGK